MLKLRLAGCLLCVSILSVLSACGGDAKPPTAPSSSSVSGAWQGTLATPIDPLGTGTPLFTDTTPITLQLSQNGTDVTGTFHLVQDGAPDVIGTLTGTISGASPGMTMQYAATYGIASNQCKATFAGTLNISSRELQGSVNGQNCVSAFAGTLHAQKSGD
jgi:hypothetical protein